MYLLYQAVLLCLVWTWVCSFLTFSGW